MPLRLDQLSKEQRKELLARARPVNEAEPQQKKAKAAEPKATDANKVPLVDMGAHNGRRRILLQVDNLGNSQGWVDQIIQRCCDLAQIPNNGGRIGWENGQYIVTLRIDSKEGRPQ